MGQLLSPPTTTAHVALQSIRSIRASPRACRWLELHVGRDSDVAFPTEVEEGRGGRRLHSTRCTARGFDDVNVL